MKNGIYINTANLDDLKNLIRSKKRQQGNTTTI